MNAERAAITLKTTISIYCLAGLSAFLLVFAQSALALGNVGGFAWSAANSVTVGDGQAVGWISFNKDTIDHVAGDSASSYDYGVSIASDGTMSGYAWAGADKVNGNNEGIGWISFNSADVQGCGASGSPCAGAACTAKVSKTLSSGRYNVSGWARVISVCPWNGTNCTGGGADSNSGGWDGCIYLGSTPKNPDGVYVDPSGDFHGFAYSDMVLGYISFNCADCNGTNCTACTAANTYKVHTLPSAPTAKMECGGSSCPGGYCDNINAGTQWIMYKPIGCPACAYSVDSSLSTGANCTYWSLTNTATGALAFQSNLSGFTFPTSVQPGNYTLRLTVSDQAYDPTANPTCAAGNTDTDSRPFWIKGEAQAKFKCSFDNPDPLVNPDPSKVIWQDCTTPNNAFSKKVVKGETIYVTDNGSQFSEGASAINSWNWTFTVDGTPTNAATNSFSDWTSFTTGAINAINLKVIDNYAGTGGNRSGCASTSITASKVFKWQEVSPVGMIWQYLTATVSKMFTTK